MPISIAGSTPFGLQPTLDPTLMSFQNGAFGSGMIDPNLFGTALQPQYFNTGFGGSMNGFWGSFPQQGFGLPQQDFNGMTGPWSGFPQSNFGGGMNGFWGGFPQPGFGTNPFNSFNSFGTGPNPSLVYPYGIPNTPDPYAGNLLSIVGRTSSGEANAVLNKFYYKNIYQYPGETTKQTWDLHLESDEKQVLRSYAILHPGSAVSTLVQIAEGSNGLFRRDNNPYARWFGPYALASTTPTTIVPGLDPFLGFPIV